MSTQNWNIFLILNCLGRFDDFASFIQSFILTVMLEKFAPASYFPFSK